MKLIECNREYQDLVSFYTDSGMSMKEAELRAKADIMQALAVK
jgi:hypothetical protein